jgi:hypothetical protein
MKFINYINESVSDLDKKVKKIIKDSGLPAAKWRTTAIRGYNVASSPGINTRYDVYDIDIDTHKVSSADKPKLESLKAALTAAGISYSEQFSTIRINRKENSAGVVIELSADAQQVLKRDPLNIMFKNPRLFTDEQKKIYNELAVKRLVQTKLVRNPITKKQELLVMFTKLGEKTRHLL